MADLKEAKILMIEDDDTQRYMYELQFKNLGYTGFSTINNGQEGLELASKSTPDLILLDINLEDMDGIEVLRRLKSDDKTSHISVIILSNMREKDKGEEAKQLGAADYILKAKYLPREIVERVEQFLTNKVK